MKSSTKLSNGESPSMNLSMTLWKSSVQAVIIEWLNSWELEALKAVMVHSGKQCFCVCKEGHCPIKQHNWSVRKWRFSRSCSNKLHSITNLLVFLDICRSFLSLAEDSFFVPKTLHSSLLLLVYKCCLPVLLFFSEPYRTIRYSAF